MNLTSGQLQTLKTSISANVNTVAFGGAQVAINALPNTDDADIAIRNWYNQTANPSFTAWKTMVTLRDILYAMDGNELAGLTTANTSRLQVRAGYGVAGENPSIQSVRDFYASVFSVGGVSATAFLVLFKRLTTNAEKLFSTGTGSDGSPATMSTTAEGQLSQQEVRSARNLP